MTNREQPEDRWQTIKQIWRDEKFVYQVLGGIALVGFGVLLGRMIFFPGDGGYWTNVYTELIGIGATVFVVDALARRRERQRVDQAERERLIRDLGSRVNDVAVRAAEEMQENGMLYDGSLVGAILFSANLSGANLNKANLANAHLIGANMKDTELYGANLSGASLRSVDFSGAMLVETDLSNTDLSYANFSAADLVLANLTRAVLEHANLSKAILRATNLQKAVMCSANLKKASLQKAQLEGVDFTDANLVEARLEDAVFGTTTILPDAANNPELGNTGAFWTSETDMTRYTDREHSDFYYSEAFMAKRVNKHYESISE